MKYKIISRKKLLATRLFDIAGQAVFWPATWFRKRHDIDQRIEEILIIRTAYTGDIVMTLPILKPLKERFPKARISFITSSAGCELLSNNPYVGRLFRFNPFWFYRSSIAEYVRFLRRIRRERFDLVIEARGDLREILFIVFPLKARFKLSHGFGGGSYLLTHVVPFTGVKHRVEYHLDLIRYLGCATDTVVWEISLTPEEDRTVNEIMRLNSIRQPFIAVHPGARLPLKKWPFSKCCVLYDRIIETCGMPLVILGSRQETGMVKEITQRMTHKPIALAGKLSLRQLAGILSKAALFVCNDSAPMHIAAAMKTPTVAIFGPSKSRETAPYQGNCRVVEKDFPCRLTCDESVCKNKVHHECMQAVRVEDVFNAVRELLE